MNLISLTFAVFFLLVLVAYRPDHKYLVIAAAGCVFYGWGSPLRVALLFLATGIIYLGGLLMERSETPKQKRAVFALFFALTVSILNAETEEGSLCPVLCADRIHPGRIQDLKLPRCLSPGGSFLLHLSGCFLSAGRVPGPAPC